MSIKINKNDKEYPLGFVPQHYPADRVYLDGDVNKTVQDAIDELSSTNRFTITGNATRGIEITSPTANNVCKFGGICQASVEIKIPNATYPSNELIASGFPKPKMLTKYKFYSNDNNQDFEANLDTDGNLRFIGYTNLTAQDWYLFQCTYILAETQ